MMRRGGVDEIDDNLTIPVQLQPYLVCVLHNIFRLDVIVLMKTLLKFCNNIVADIMLQ